MGTTDPSENSSSFKPKPWSISLEGLINNPQVLDLEKLLQQVTVEDRVYRLRCVEAWSMVIPWQGFSLSELIKFIRFFRSPYSALEPVTIQILLFI